jgi:hypothetical protein
MLVQHLVAVVLRSCHCTLCTQYCCRCGWDCFFLLQDNSTFVHVPQWSDAHTTANNVGLLLAVNGASPSVLAGTEPAPGRNFVLAADSSTLLSVMQLGAAVRTSVPFLMYLSSNISFSSAQLKVRILPVNRPLIVVGLSTDNTSIDFGMEVNSLQLGPLGSITLLQAILENLAPGDARSAELAGPYEVSMTYYLWAVAFDRCARRGGDSAKGAVCRQRKCIQPVHQPSKLAAVCSLVAVTSLSKHQGVKSLVDVGLIAARQQRSKVSAAAQQQCIVLRLGSNSVTSK